MIAMYLAVNVYRIPYLEDTMLAPVQFYKLRYNIF